MLPSSRRVLEVKYVLAFAGGVLASILMLVAGAIWNLTSLSATGGAVLATSILGWLARSATRDMVEETLLCLEGSLHPGFSSDPVKLASYRTQLHLYYVTEMDSRMVWRYLVVDFTRSLPVDKLVASVGIPDKRGKEQLYTAEAGLRDERLVLFFRASVGEEPSCVFVFPFMGLRFEDRHCGFVVLQTWDKTNCFSSAIIAETPIFNYAQIGSLPDEFGKKLDAEWSTDIGRSVHLLPRILPKSASPAKP